MIHNAMELKVSWSLGEVMEGYLWLYICALSGRKRSPGDEGLTNAAVSWPGWCSALLADTTASLSLHVRSSAAPAQDKANQRHMQRGWTLQLGPGVSHPRRTINQLQTHRFSHHQSTPEFTTAPFSPTQNQTHSWFGWPVMYRTRRRRLGREAGTRERKHLSDCTLCTALCYLEEGERKEKIKRG